jgi:methylphosphotriester-DNA--protein-cysteine methyltransferase
VQYWESPPPAPLASHVRCFWSLRDGAARSPRPLERVVPDGCVEWVFHLGDPFARVGPDGEAVTQRPAVFAGQLRGALRLRPGARVEVFGIRFQPWGAGPFSGHALHETTGLLPALDEVLGPAWRGIDGAVRAERDDEGRARAASRWLLERAGRRAPPPAEVVGTARALIAAAGRLDVASAAHAAGTGVRRLERLFRQHVGLGPKTLARVARVQSVLRRVRDGRPAPWARVALDHGYADQSHLVREFADLVGTTPTAYARETHALADWLVSPGSA